ncbi:MAG: hypothetical protein RMK91_11685 [Pseudanabaenaceae cyanobacterium SKYGB_i_bin29]|nr:hypothetical protein [Pseudanabaenaceae cyanobacterium SKYG29]MDW8422514.1 hypothetical protein [Pseudanabaenaceae cyanobacterium SKYGB_i_bin29]
MAGFFGWLFNRNNDQGGDSYFLDPDTAKTLGDINYMRKPSTVRRTFAKTKSGGGGEVVVQVSSLEKKVIEEKPGMDSSSSTTNQTQFTPQPTDRRSAKDSNSLDFFRNMAKEIRRN